MTFKDVIEYWLSVKGSVIIKPLLDRYYNIKGVMEKRECFARKKKL